MIDKFLRGTSVYALIHFTQYIADVPLPYTACKSRFVANLSIATLIKWKLCYPTSYYPRNVT